MEETVQQLKDARMIEHLGIALRDLERYNTSPIILQSMIQLQQALINEYNQKYSPESTKEKKSENEPED